MGPSIQRRNNVMEDLNSEITNSEANWMCLHIVGLGKEQQRMLLDI